jgi:hypothetical protein
VKTGFLHRGSPAKLLTNTQRPQPTARRPFPARRPTPRRTHQARPPPASRPPAALTAGSARSRTQRKLAFLHKPYVPLWWWSWWSPCGVVSRAGSMNLRGVSAVARVASSMRVIRWSTGGVESREFCRVILTKPHDAIRPSNGMPPEPRRVSEPLGRYRRRVPAVGSSGWFGPTPPTPHAAPRPGPWRRRQTPPQGERSLQGLPSLDLEILQRVNGALDSAVNDETIRKFRCLLKQLGYI